MLVFEVVIALLLSGVVLTALAKKIGAPYPALVALAGAVIALIPGIPTLVLDPELALTLFIAPVLLDAAFDSSPRDMKENWKAITSLALGAVVLTVVVVALVAHLLVPELPWAAAVALGAIVAPPDAAASTTVLKQLKPPYRLLNILEGESLFNDATALLIYRISVGTVLTGAISGWSIAQNLFFVSVGSIALAYVLSKIVVVMLSRIEDLAMAVVFQFCAAFAIWMAAERLNLSGVITVVVFAILAARDQTTTMNARMRLPAWAIWEVAVYVLNVLAFVLVGFQLKSILERTELSVGLRYAGFSCAILFAVILVRLVWVFAASIANRWNGINLKEAAVVGWSGMRGTVTLATALALPIDFPYRDWILATAFAVTLGTLILQGLTLRPLLRKLDIQDDRSVEKEIELAREESLKAAVAAISRTPASSGATLAKQSFEMQLGHVRNQNKNENDQIAALSAALKAQRAKLVALKDDNEIGSAAFQRVQEELDWMELGWRYALRPEEQ